MVAQIIIITVNCKYNLDIMNVALYLLFILYFKKVKLNR